MDEYLPLNRLQESENKDGLHPLYQTADPFYYDILKEFARENRKFMTEAERILWNNISCKKLGLPFRKQHIIGKYIADFVCLQRKLVIEVDGGYHSQYIQQQYDLWRTEDIENMGYKVIRFNNEDIYTNLSKVLDTIFDNL